MNGEERNAHAILEETRDVCRRIDKLFKKIDRCLPATNRTQEVDCRELATQLMRMPKVPARVAARLLDDLSERVRQALEINYVHEWGDQYLPLGHLMARARETLADAVVDGMADGICNIALYQQGCELTEAELLQVTAEMRRLCLASRRNGPNRSFS